MLVLFVAGTVDGGCWYWKAQEGRLGYQLGGGAEVSTLLVEVAFNGSGRAWTWAEESSGQDVKWPPFLTIGTHHHVERAGTNIVAC